MPADCTTNGQYSQPGCIVGRPAVFGQPVFRSMQRDPCHGPLADRRYQPLEYRRKPLRPLRGMPL